MTADWAPRRWKPGALARNTALATAWQGVRLALQFAYLILVARVLGVEDYGVFAGSLALAASLSPLVGWGYGMILVQEVSRSPQRFPEFWAKALRAVALSGPITAAFMLALAPLLLPVESHWTVILLIAAAELIAMPLVVAGSQAYLGHERLGWTMFNHVQLNLVRFGAVAMLAALGRGGLLEFAWAYFGATVMAAALSFVQVHQAFGTPEWRQSGLSGRFREGLFFSLSVVANTAHGELDKALLLRLGSAAAAGNYSLANRVVSATAMPLIAYILAAVPRLFREGQQGTSAALALRLLPPILVYGIAVAAGLVACAPLLPWVFGAEYSETLRFVCWLALLPLLVGVSQLGLNVLSASGRQRTRVKLEWIALGANVGLNIVLIPLWGAQGAVLAMLSSQSLLALMPIAAIALLERNAMPFQGTGSG
ncbi:hypothetical protein ED208_02460 [Stagnimonas aquatica]|uniref:Uncharacterized protein n=1 Tax=Stagnimonas aquatica TaxID=2689987 RepID=A0A3N0VL21_9GAMM|nr:oligosaccharide flippase family protein [Stagnimonas aquatica]ROH93401.1 hypothetical protein ED208_02460 [Stagnimonas aquatica]